MEFTTDTAFSHIIWTNFSGQVTLEGTAMPGDLLGHSDGILHSAGMTENSILTSWTTNRAVAERFATNGASGRGVILETTLEQQAHRTVRGLALGESEVLIRGIVTG
jgi:hypothetical protein